MRAVFVEHIPACEHVRLLGVTAPHWRRGLRETLALLVQRDTPP
jgi:hypothetical protein